jgi:hypothetical protein
MDEMNCWERCFLCGSCLGVISRTSAEYSVVRQSAVSKDTNTEAEEATALSAVTRQQPVKAQQSEKT